MKMIVAVIKPTRLEEVKRALEAANFTSMTVSEVKGRGQQKGVIQQWRGQEYRVDMLSKIKIEIVVEDIDVERLINTIVENARTGSIGDGKIFVLPVEKTVRIRTGETDGKAL
jgi:nitrogen regulatory protein P-II 1